MGSKKIILVINITTFNVQHLYTKDMLKREVNENEWIYGWISGNGVW